MRAVTIDRIRKTGSSWGIAALFAVVACGCTAMASSPEVASTPQRSAQASRASGASNRVADSASTSVQSRSPGFSSTPPQWPWRGITMINPGAKPQDIDMLKQRLGINSVHLYLHLQQIAKAQHLTPGQAWTQGMAWLDQMLAECKKDGVVGIVSLKSFPAPNGSYYKQGSSEFWNSPSAVNEIYTEVAALAKHLHAYGSEFAAYDILNEPVLRTPSGPKVPPHWDEIQSRIIQVIRAQDPGRWIVVKPGPWGGVRGYRNYQAPDYPGLVYSVHIYAPPQYTSQGVGRAPLGVNYPGTVLNRPFNKQALEVYMRPLVAFQQRYNALIWVGEFSAVRWAPGSDQYLRDLVSIFDSHGWGWSYFSFGGWKGWDPRYDNTYEVSGVAAASHFVGTKSQRWHTLEAMFGVGH